MFCLAMITTLLFSGVVTSVNAQELVTDQHTTMKAKVLEVVEQEVRDIPGTDTKTNYQTLKVKVLDGEKKGDTVTVENDYFNLEEGDIFYLMHTVDRFDGLDYYSVAEPYRLPTIYFFVGLFVL